MGKQLKFYMLYEDECCIHCISHPQEKTLRQRTRKERGDSTMDKMVVLGNQQAELSLALNADEPNFDVSKGEQMALNVDSCEVS